VNDKGETMSRLKEVGSEGGKEGGGGGKVARGPSRFDAAASGRRRVAACPAITLAARGATGGFDCRTNSCTNGCIQRAAGSSKAVSSRAPMRRPCPCPCPCACAQVNDDWIMRRLERWGRRDAMPFVGPEKAALLQGLVRQAQPQLVVEVGTMAGYSAIAMAQVRGGAAGALGCCWAAAAAGLLRAVPGWRGWSGCAAGLACRPAARASSTRPACAAGQRLSRRQAAVALPLSAGAAAWRPHHQHREGAELGAGGQALPVAGQPGPAGAGAGAERGQPGGRRLHRACTAARLQWARGRCALGRALAASPIKEG
jgi:hypothetical protein